MILDCAHAVGAPVPMTAEVQEIFQWLHNHDKGQADTAPSPSIMNI